MQGIYPSFAEENVNIFVIPRSQVQGGGGGGGQIAVAQHMNVNICTCTSEFRPQLDQRSDYSNLQHVKGETGRNRYKAVS